MFWLQVLYLNSLDVKLIRYILVINPDYIWNHLEDTHLNVSMKAFPD